MKKADIFFLKNTPKFLGGATAAIQFPKAQLPHVAFIGRSNVGKSTLINTLTSHQIARTSKTPGRTRELNFFNIANEFILTDMPGYGFANVSEEERRRMHNLIYSYLSSWTEYGAAEDITNDTTNSSNNTNVYLNVNANTDDAGSAAHTTIGPAYAELMLPNTSNPRSFSAMLSKGFLGDGNGNKNMGKNRISGRNSIRLLFLLIDSRRGLGVYDLEFMQILDELSINYTIVLTKTDKVAAVEVEKLMKSIKLESHSHPTMDGEILAVSSSRGYGIDNFRQGLYLSLVTNSK